MIRSFKKCELRSCVGFVRAPGKQVTGSHRGGNHGHRAIGGCFHAPHFARAQRRHALGGVINLLPAIETNFISLLIKRKWPCLAPVAAAEYNIVEKTKQVLNELHINLSLASNVRVVVDRNRTVKMHSARNRRVCRRDFAAFVLPDHPKVTDLWVSE
jgi:hypothetical protein